MEERGDLVQGEEGHWVEGPALDWETLPARVEAVIAERIGRLAGPSQQTLRVASVEGETFTAEVLARVRAADEQEIVGHLSGELDRKHRLVSARGILRTDPALSGTKGSQRLSLYRFRHILFQKYLYSSLDPVERAHLHQAVGTALEALYGEGSESSPRFESTASRGLPFTTLSSAAPTYSSKSGEGRGRTCPADRGIRPGRQKWGALSGGRTASAQGGAAAQAELEELS